MTKPLVTVGFVVLIAFPATAVYAQPSLSKEGIPANAAPEVRAQIERLYAREPVARVEAATTLGEMGESAAPAVPFLIDILRDNSSMVALPRKLTARYMPADTVTFAAGDTVMDFESLSAQVALARIGEPALKPLEAAAKNESEAIRYGAVRALGQVNSAAATEALARLFADPGYQTGRVTVVRALADRGDPKAVELLRAGLKDPNPEVRKAAETGLSKMKAK
jgi:HEAT repeat protein